MKKSFKIGIGVVGGLFILLSLLSCCMVGVAYCAVDKNYFDGEANPYITDDGETMVSAHRAGSLVSPENTLFAFTSSIAEATDEDGGYKVDIWEFDLHITKDNQLILLHDDTLDRTSNSEEVFGVSNAKPEDYTLAELQQLNMGYYFEYDGEYIYRDLTQDEVIEMGLTVCTLDEVLSYLESEEARIAAPEGRFSYIIEIKKSGKLGKKAADILYETLVEYDLIQQVVFGTFNQDVSDYMDENYPEVLRSASIAEVLDFYLAYLTNADLSKRGVGYCALQIPYSKTISFLGTEGLIEYAHKYNIAVQYWTINEEDDMEYLQSIGADCIMSDSPDVCYNVLKG